MTHSRVNLFWMAVLFLGPSTLPLQPIFAQQLTKGSLVRHSDLIVARLRVEAMLPQNEMSLAISDENDWPEEPRSLNLRIVFFPSNTRVASADITKINYAGPGRRNLFIKLSPSFVVPEGDKEIEISLKAESPGEALDVQARSALATQELARSDRELRHSLAIEKASDEKESFFQIQAAAPGGGFGSIGINKALYRANPSKSGPLSQVFLIFNYGKGGGKKADPRFFNVGVGFRKTFFGSGRGTDLAKLNLAATSEQQQQVQQDDAETAVSLTERRTAKAREALDQLKLKRGPEWFLNYAGVRLESNLKGLRPGSVNNLLFPSSIELRTALKPLRLRRHCDDPAKPCGTPSFLWSYRLAPAVLEAGKNLRNHDLPATSGGAIARLGAEAGIKIFYPSPCRYNTLFAGIVFEGKFVDRYLFKKESAFDRVTNKTDLTTKGNQYLLQLDFRYLMGFKFPEDLTIVKPLSHLKLPKLGRRPALTFTYVRGMVPPVFAFNNAFKVGFTFETLDDNNSSDVGSVVSQRTHH